MKKKLKQEVFYKPSLLKRKWIMSTFFTFFLISFLQANPIGMQVNINLSVSNASLESVIWQLNKQTGFTFLYSSDDIEDIQGVNLNVENESLENILDDCLTENGLDYTVNENTVIIMKSKPEDLINEPEEIEITGKVTDINGDPLPGATILEDGTLNGYVVIKAPITSLTKEAVKDLEVDNKMAIKSKNMFALG